MASIEYGIDGYGRKVLAQNVQSNRTYICPVCHKEIIVRKGNQRKAYFAHKNKHNRTLEERACPWYTGKGTNDKIISKIDHVYIFNGGLPLYLNSYSKGKYELKAYFPPLRQSSIRKMEEWGVKVCIEEDGFPETVYSIQNVKSYKLKSLGQRVEISCINSRSKISEVQHKWEWGIRGLNMDKDIFHANSNGGYRVALNSNIVLGKEYLIVSNENDVHSIEGVSFQKKGILRLRSTNKLCEFNVYEMRIQSKTDEAIKYIQTKGYKLVEKSDELIPMWPPAVIEGKEIIYRNSHDAFLYHVKESDQRLFSLDHIIRSFPQNSEIILTDTDNKTLLLSDYEFNSFSSEIRYILTHTRDNYDKHQFFKPKILCKVNNQKYNLFDKGIIDNIKGCKLSFDADIKVGIYVLKGNYLELSKKRVLGELKSGRKLVLDLGPFGKKWVENTEFDLQNHFNKNMDLYSRIELLYNCKAYLIPLPRDFARCLEYSKSISIDLYKIMLKWKLMRKMPYSAINELQ